MHSFTDNANPPRTWELRINVGAVKRIKGLLKDEDGKPLDLSRLLDDGLKGFSKLLGDVVLFVDVLYVLCEQQAKDSGITDVQFGESLGGDALEKAVDAFREELIDFFPVAKARQSLRGVLEKSREIGNRMMDKGMKKMELIDLEAESDKMIGSLSSTPTPVS